MQYNDIMAMTAPYFSYMFNKENVCFYYNFIPVSVNLQTYICILPDSTLGTLIRIDNSCLTTSPSNDIFLEFTDLIITSSDKSKTDINYEDQQKLLDKVQEFRITHPELFI